MKYRLMVRYWDEGVHVSPTYGTGAWYDIKEEADRKAEELNKEQEQFEHFYKEYIVESVE